MVNDLNSFQAIAKDIGNCDAVCFSNEPRCKKIEAVMIYPWQEGIKEFFGS